MKRIIRCLIFISRNINFTKIAQIINKLDIFISENRKLLKCKRVKFVFRRVGCALKRGFLRNITEVLVVTT